MPLPFELRRRKLFSILSLVAASNERCNRKESQKDDKTVRSAETSLCAHSCNNPSCHLKPLTVLKTKRLTQKANSDIFTGYIWTCHNRKHTGVTYDIPFKWNRDVIKVKVSAGKWSIVVL